MNNKEKIIWVKDPISDFLKGPEKICLIKVDCICKKGPGYTCSNLKINGGK